MANLTKVAEILKDAKVGQFVSCKCEKNSSEFTAHVVQLESTDVQGIKAEDWTEGWPS